MPERIFIALGSNLGDRNYLLNSAIEHIRDEPEIEVVKVSSFYETEPQGGPPDQDSYLNAVLEATTTRTASEIMDFLLQTETKLGRVRQEKNAPRTIDLDLLLFGDWVFNEENLQVPHPRMHQRSFVLEPLAEIAPEVKHPVIGETIADLWKNLQTVQVELEEQEPAALTLSAPVMRHLEGKKVVITGSTSGIGRAMALAFAEAGADVMVHGRRQSAAEKVVSEVKERNVQADFFLADLQKSAECERFARKVWKDWGPVDVWVNNAGADTLTGDAGDWPFFKKLQTLFVVDVVATIIIARKIGKRMKRQGSGLILNMGWDQAETGMDGDSGQLFGAIKGGVMAFSKSLAVSLAPKVRVNCLAPGWIKTAWGGQASDYWQKRVREETPLARWGTAEDVAAAAVWLASPQADFITGQIIRINGGAVR